MRYSITVPDQEYFDKNIPCRSACPIHTECGRYVQAIGISKDEEAYLLARAPNPFAYVLGRICAHPCEDNCRRGKIDEPIAICALKRYATDRHNLGTGHDPARKKLPPAPKRGKRIAIVGAGVCGLTCAHDLALLGTRWRSSSPLRSPAECSIWAFRSSAFRAKSSRWKWITSWPWASRCTPA